MLVMKDTGQQFGNTASKIATVHEYLVNHVRSPDDLVVLMDAFDTWAQETPAEMLAKYDALATPILFATNEMC